MEELWRICGLYRGLAEVIEDFNKVYSKVYSGSWFWFCSQKVSNPCGFGCFLNATTASGLRSDGSCEDRDEDHPDPCDGWYV